METDAITQCRTQLRALVAQLNAHVYEVDRALFLAAPGLITLLSILGSVARYRGVGALFISPFTVMFYFCLLLVGHGVVRVFGAWLYRRGWLPLPTSTETVQHYTPLSLALSLSMLLCVGRLHTPQKKKHYRVLYQRSGAAITSDSSTTSCANDIVAHMIDCYVEQVLRHATNEM